MNLEVTSGIKCLTSLVSVKGKKCFFDAKGLKGRHVRGGIYEFWTDDRLLNVVSVQVQIMPPFSDEKVNAVVRRCWVHGCGCWELGEDCKAVESLVLVPRWSAFARIGKKKVSVVVLRRPKMKTIADKKMRTVSKFEASFAVMVMVR